MCEVITLKELIQERLERKQEVLNDKKRELDNQHGIFNHDGDVISRMMDKLRGEINSLEWVLKNLK